MLRLPAQATPVSHLPAFRAPRACPRHRSRAPKYRACQHKRRLCRARQRLTRPERAPRARARAGQGSRAPEYCACQHKRHLCRARQRIARPECARGKGPGLNTAPASTNDTCVAPANVSRAPSARAARVRAPKYHACQHKRHLCRARQRFARPERARGKGPGPLNTAPASTNDTCVAPANVSRAPSARGAPVQGP